MRRSFSKQAVPFPVPLAGGAELCETKILPADTLNLGTGSKTYHQHFNGVGDMVRAARLGHTRADLYRFDFFSEPGWIGRRFNTFDDIVTAVDGTWAEGVDRIEEMSRELEREELPRPMTIKRRRVWDEFAGNEIDVDRYRAGEPFFRENVRQAAPGPKLITFLIQCGANAFRSSDSLFWRGALAITLARIVEDAGYRTEMTGFTLGSYRTENPQISDMLDTVNLKQAGEPLDVGSLANVTSGWFFRTVTFASWTLPGERLAGGLGQTLDAKAETAAYLAPGARPWLVAGVYDKASALKLARELLSTLQPAR